MDGSGGVGGKGLRALCGFGKVREYGFEKERFRDSRFCEPRSGLAVGVRLSSSRCTPWYKGSGLFMCPKPLRSLTG